MPALLIKLYLTNCKKFNIMKGQSGVIRCCAVLIDTISVIAAITEMCKKSFLAILLLVSLFCYGCTAVSITGTSDNSDASIVEEIPNGAIFAEEGRKIELTDITIELSEGMKYGKVESDDRVSYYVWKSKAEYVLPASMDVIFYVYEGNDKKTPDSALNDTQAHSSMSAYITNGFAAEVEQARITKDPLIVNNDDWHTLVFTAYGGSHYEVTTYGSYCYPKSFYGIYVLGRNYIEKTHSRKNYGFVFSNDSEGNIFEQKEYEYLLKQIKKSFDIEKFYTPPQITYDKTKDYSQGYSYEQFQNLFFNTTNYYIIINEKLISETSDGAESTTR